MRRNALRTFFERVIVASLPLAAPACHSAASKPPQTTGASDLAMASATDMAVSTSANDLANAPTLDLATTDLDTCEVNHPVTVVNMPASYLPDGGFKTLCVTGSPCSTVCPTDYVTCCSPQPSDGGALLVHCTYNCGPVGRRPAGLAEPTPSDGCALGQYFAATAHLEAASVHAFRSLARELVAHGAPRHLVAAARRAAREEIRHARLTRQMARAHGSEPTPVAVQPAPSRSLEAMATENATEGCVRETFGALLASWQARTAGDASVRAMMAEIAVDETGHAELAWAIDRWLRPRLGRAARRRVTDARRAAVAKLTAELTQPLPDALAHEVGLPDPARARQLLEAVERELWA